METPDHCGCDTNRTVGTRCDDSARLDCKRLQMILPLFFWVLVIFIGLRQVRKARPIEIPGVTVTVAVPDASTPTVTPAPVEETKLIVDADPTSVPPDEIPRFPSESTIILTYYVND